MDALECPCCCGDGRIASLSPKSMGIGVGEVLRGLKAKVDHLARAVGRASELRVRYIAEGGADDHRIRLCDEEIAAWTRVAVFHGETMRTLRHADMAALCIQCRGSGELVNDDSFAPQSSEEMITALQRAVA